MMAANHIDGFSLTENLQRGIPFMIMNTRSFSKNIPDTLQEAFDNVINYCKIINKRETEDENEKTKFQ